MPSNPPPVPPGQFGSGSTTAINPHGGKTNMLQWLGKYLSTVKKGVVTQAKAAGSEILNLPISPSTREHATDVFTGIQTGRRGRKQTRENFRIRNEQLSNRQEGISQGQVRFREHLGSTGIVGKQIGGVSATDYQFRTQQRQLDLAKQQTFANRRVQRKQEKSSRLRRLLFR